MKIKALSSVFLGAKLKIDSAALGKAFGVPVVEISALHETHIDELARVAVEVAQKRGHLLPMHRFSGGVENALGHIGGSGFA